MDCYWIGFIGYGTLFMGGFPFDFIKGDSLAIVSGAFFGLQFYLNSKKQADASSSMNIQYLFSILFFLFYVIKKLFFHFQNKM